jgi:hypothetical protein
LLNEYCESVQRVLRNLRIIEIGRSTLGKEEHSFFEKKKKKKKKNKKKKNKK